MLTSLYLDRGTWIHRLHPSVKLFALFIMFWSVFWVDQPLALMPIAIVRMGSLYEATVTPPHGGGVPWSTDSPMTRQDLIAALRGRGCHQTDIGDAFYEADPDWLQRE